MNFSPKTLLALCAMVCLLIVGLTTALALQAKWTGVVFTLTDGGLLQASSRSADLSNAHLNNVSVAAFLAAGKVIPADAVLMIEEPDVLPDYAQYNQLMKWQSQLALAAEQQQLFLRSTDGQEYPLWVEPRPLTSLPPLFWLQLFFGVSGALTGALVWSTRRHNIAARLYALTGVGYLIFAPAAAIYSTRELILDGELFRLLALTNHFGALLFTASLTCLLWCYPRPIKYFNVIFLIYAAALLFWLIDALQLINPMVFHFGVLGIFSLSFILAFIQWRYARRQPVERAALRWLLLSIYLATGLFAAVIILPAALHLPQPASQGVMFGAFLIMYWGLALGIVRYRLFSIEQWWHTIMTWFVGGLCVLLLDIVLIVGLALPQDMALSLAVALTGWLYFPLRQFLWDKFGHRQGLEIGDWLPDVLPKLMAAEDVHQSHVWQNSLRRVWHALDVKQVSGALAKPEIVDDGLTLNVPDISADSGCHYRIHCASAGQRLFTQRDIQSFFSLQKISVLVLQITEARALGAQQERQRIRRDIHDDMGAHLLTLLHSCPTNLQPLVRDLLRATRELVQTLNLHAVDSLTACDAWQAEAEQRCKIAGVKLQWNHYPDALPRKFSARAHVNLSRILREAISNALKHAMPSKITINLQASGECSEITISDNGRMGRDSSWVEGNGCRIMRQRVEEIGGELAWKIDQGCTVCIRLPVVQR